MSDTTQKVSNGSQDYYATYTGLNSTTGAEEDYDTSWYTDSSYEDTDPTSAESDGYNWDMTATDPWAEVDDGLDEVEDEPEETIHYFETDANPVIAHVAQEDLYESFVYLPEGRADGEFYNATFNGIPLSSKIVATMEEGADGEMHLVLEITDREGKKTHRHVVDYDPNSSRIIVNGGDSLDLSALPEDVKKLIYWNTTPPVETTGTVVKGTTKTVTAAELVNGNTFEYYTSGDDVKYSFTPPEGTTYTVEYDETDENTFDVTLHFWDEQGNEVSTAVIHDVNAAMEGMTKIEVAGAPLTNEDDIVDENVQYVFDLAEPENVDPETGDYQGEAGDRTNSMAKSMGIEPSELLSAYQNSPIAKQDQNNDGKIDFTDLEAYLNGITQPTTELVQFIELADTGLQTIHQEIYGIVGSGDSSRQNYDSDDSLDSTFDENQLFASYGSKALLDAQDRYTERLASIFKGAFGDKQTITGTGDTSGHVWYADNDKKSAAIQDGDEKDNFQFGKDKWWDLFDLRSGEIMVKRATRVDDYYSLKYYEDYDGAGSDYYYDLLANGKWQEFDSKSDTVSESGEIEE